MKNKAVIVKPAAIISALAIILALGSPAGAGTRVMRGKHKVILDIVAADWENHPVEDIPDYSNRTYTQKVLQKDEFGARVLIEANMERMNADTPFPVRGLPGSFDKYLRAGRDIQSNHPSIVEKAKQLTRGAKTVAEAVEAISNWVHDHIDYTIPVAQDALSVYRSGKGSCQGYTRLTIALCRAAGIPARYAHGYLVPGEKWGARVERFGVKTHGGGYHAWVEIYYPGYGWAFTDGEYTKGYVDPYHILRWIDDEPSTPVPDNPVENLNADTGNTYSKVEDTDTSRWIDYYPGPEKDILGLPIRPQRTGSVWGYLKDADEKPIRGAKLIVWGKPDAAGRVKGKVLSLPDEGIWSVAGLSSGTHRISIKVGDRKKDYRINAERGKIKRKDLVF